MGEEAVLKSKRVNPFNSFVVGANKGFVIATKNMMPNVLMAYCIIKFLDLSGLTGVIGNVMGPVMGIFSLPGIASTILVGAFISTGGACGITAALYAAGSMTAVEVALVTPGVFLMGGLLQYMGRVLALIEINTKHYILMFGICIINALCAILVMNLFV